MDTKEFFWLVGLLEGEGSFLKPTPSQPHSPAISVQMTDEDVIQKVSVLLGSKYQTCKPQKSHHKVSFRIMKRGYKAVELMKKLFPHMGVRRQSQITRAIYNYSPNRKLLTPEVKRKIVKTYRNGMVARKVAQKFGIRRETVHRINKQYSSDSW